MTTFQRFLNVASTFQAGTVLIDNTDGEGLHMTWSGVRTMSPEPDQCEVRIANMSLANRKLVSEQMRNFAPFKGTLMQGWDGLAHLLMFAEIYDIVPDDREDPTTTWTTFRMGENMEGYRDGVVSTSIGDVDAVLLANLIVKGMSIEIDANNLAVIQSAVPGSKMTKFKNGAVIMGAARDRMNELMGMLKLRWTVQNGHAVIEPAGQPVLGQAVVLTPHNGLLKWKVERDGSIALTCLSTPSIVPGKQLIVQDENLMNVGEIAYRVSTVTFAGDSRLGAQMQLEARSDLL